MSIPLKDRVVLGNRLVPRVAAVRSLASTRNLALLGTIAVAGFLVITPLYFLVHDTFTTASGFSLDSFKRAYVDESKAPAMIVNSMVFALGSAAVALVVGTMLAYVQVRTDAPLKGLFFAASLVPLIIPGVLYTIIWVFLADPDIGIINANFFVPIFGHSVVNVFSMGGMIFVQGLHHAPIAFLLLVGAFRGMDPSLEEAAIVSGASRTAVLRRVTLPLIKASIGAAALLMFVQSLESFEVPALLGLQSGTYMFTSLIYFVLRSYPPDYGAAGAYALGLLVIASIGVLLNNLLLRNAKSNQTISGKAFRARPLALGRARPFVGALAVIYFFFTVLLPLAVLAYASFLPYYRPPSKAAFGSFTLDNYRELGDNPIVASALKNSILLGVGTATAVMALSAIAGWYVVRTKMHGRSVLDLLFFSPLVIPGIVLGLAVAFVYLRVPLPIYGTLAILLIAYTTRYLPYGMRYSSAAMAQMSDELEEAAQVSGASWWATFRRILLPLSSSGLIAGWVYILIVSFRELSSSILLYSPGSEVLAVLIFQQFQNGSFTVVAAIGMMMVTILVLLVVLAYRLGARIGLRPEA